MKQIQINQIKDHHEKAQAAANEALSHALEAGKLLVDVKAEATHGDWLPMLDSIGINPRTAQRYMKLAKNEHLLKSDSVSHLSVTKALEFLAEPKQKTLEDIEGEIEVLLDDMSGDMGYLFMKNEDELFWAWTVEGQEWLILKMILGGDGGCEVETFNRLITTQGLLTFFPELTTAGRHRGIPYEAVLHRAEAFPEFKSFMEA